MKQTIHYFAYGSNLLTRRLRERTPSASVVASGILRRYELRWHKAAQDESGKCDIVAVDRADALVRGVVYELDASEKPMLDAAETLGTGYAEMELEIETDSGPIVAWAYYALKIDADAVPYDWYKALVVAGAREHAFDRCYIEMLESTPAKPDADSIRAARHFKLTNAV